MLTAYISIADRIAITEDESRIEPANSWPECETLLTHPRRPLRPSGFRMFSGSPIVYLKSGSFNDGVSIQFILKVGLLKVGINFL